MNYALEYHLSQSAFLISTPRKKQLKHSLITIHNGLALIRLGKYEYVLEQDDSFWLPFDCLSAMTYLPDTQASVVEFSVRLTDSFPLQSGFVELPDVTRSIINKLALAPVPDSQLKTFLDAIRYEATELKPELILGHLSRLFSDWTAENSGSLSKEMHLALLVREAQKQRLSGIKPSTIIDSLFQGSESDYRCLCQLILGKVL